MISLENSWKIFVQKAGDFYKSEQIFFSPRESNEYKIIEVSEDRVRIKRLSVESKSEGSLTLGIFATAYNRLLDSNDIIPKGKLYGTVLFEAPIVLFLPFLDWDEGIKNILVDKTYEFALEDLNDSEDIREAKNDDINKKIIQSIRIRRGQNKLRDNLFTVYDGKCCITGCKIAEILHACHIVPHSKSGDNSLSNALLLRSDIHDLFDSHLLGINPQTLTININPRILNTEYKELHGKKISGGQEIKKIQLNILALELRWQLFKLKCTV